MTTSTGFNDDEILSQYIDRQLSATERAAFEARLNAEPELRATLEELRLTIRILRAAPQMAVPRNFTLNPTQYRRRSWFSWSGGGLLQVIGAIGAFAAIVLVTLGVLASGYKTQSAVESIGNGIAMRPTPTNIMVLAPPTATSTIINTTVNSPNPPAVPASQVNSAAAVAPSLSPQATTVASTDNSVANPKTTGIIQSAPTSIDIIMTSQAPIQAPQPSESLSAQSQAGQSVQAPSSAAVKPAAAKQPSTDTDSLDASLAAPTALSTSTVTSLARATFAPTSTAELIAAVPTNTAPTTLKASDSDYAGTAPSQLPWLLIVGGTLFFMSAVVFVIGWRQGHN